MDEKFAITAIKDIEQESYISATLIRLGWLLIYRATSPHGLIAELEKNPQATLFLTDDFLARESIYFPATILLRGRSHPLGAMGEMDPRSISDLEELMRKSKVRKGLESSLITPTQSKVLALMSAEGKIGSTTLAINMAERLANAGEKVLLVDCDQSHHAIAAHFEVHNIRSEPRTMTSNLSLFEVSERSQLEKLSTVAAHFDFILIDLGRFRDIVAHGIRLEDQIFEWIVNSHGRAILSSGDQERSITRSMARLHALKKLAPNMDFEIAISLNSPISRRNRSLLISQLSPEFSTPIHLFSRDSKAILSFEQEHAPLSQVAPKSILTREISRYVDEHLLKVSSK